nr:Ycf12 [Schizaea tenella]
MNVEIVVQLAVLASIVVSGPLVIALLAVKKGNL